MTYPIPVAARRPHSLRAGFTLLEILVVIAILGLLTAAVSVAVVPLFVNAKIDTTRNNITDIRTSLQTYFLRKGRYPDTGAGLQALVDAQIIDKMPHDGWGHDYVYLLEADKPVIVSYGADGVPGGAGPDADISSKDDPAAVATRASSMR
jgi:general secretion pathway protein G